MHAVLKFGNLEYSVLREFQKQVPGEAPEGRSEHALQAFELLRASAIYYDTDLIVYLKHAFT